MRMLCTLRTRASAGGLLAIIIGLTASFPVIAFTVGEFHVIVIQNVPVLSVHDTPNHEEITRDALNPSAFSIELTSHLRVSFTQPAREEIVHQNALTDSKYWNIPKVHFDADSFVEANAWLVGLRHAIVENAQQKTEPSAQFAREQLGMALHTVQDFYAHSTWVESQQPGIAPLGRLALSVPNFGKSPEAIGSTCNEDGPIAGLVAGSPLISGHFNIEQAIIGNNDWATTVPYPSGEQEKCIHGGSNADVNNPRTGAGLNKDSSDREGPLHRFTAAKTLATQATQQYVLDIISDLGNDDSAKLGLLGQRAWAVLGQRSWAALSAGGDHTCALTTAGGVKCWGNGTHGQLGNGGHNDGYVPVAVVGLTSGVAALSAGDTHTCALTTAGGVKCWGYGNFGQLGNGSYHSYSSVPVAVVGLSRGVAAVSAGGDHTCALTTAGGVKCWGYGRLGQLGNGSNKGSSVPVDGPVVETEGGN